MVATCGRDAAEDGEGSREEGELRRRGLRDQSGGEDERKGEGASGGGDEREVEGASALRVSGWVDEGAGSND